MKVYCSLDIIYIRTVRRRMSMYNLSVRSYYSQMSDADLDAIVAEILLHFPTCGNRQMQGLARGLRVQQYRVREAQRRVDPSGLMMCRLFSINRRTYQVNGPLALWHIDGNHKLIRYECILFILALLCVLLFTGGDSLFTGELMALAV